MVYTRLRYGALRNTSILLTSMTLSWKQACWSWAAYCICATHRVVVKGARNDVYEVTVSCEVKEVDLNYVYVCEFCLECKKNAGSFRISFYSLEFGRVEDVHFGYEVVSLINLVFSFLL